MIVLRRPITLFDVDIVGVAAAAALCGALLAIALPMLSRSGESQRLRGLLAAAQEEERRTASALTALRHQLTDLKTVADQERASIAPVSSLADALAGFAEIARALGIELTQLAPQPAKPDGPLVAVEIRLAAKGSAADCMRLLERMRTQYPWLTFEAFSLESSESGGGACQFACTIRWLAQPAETGGAKSSAAPTGGGATP
ncbi:MAG: hypothetical protein U1D55_17480 [Phycisphaerae bacterium]